MNNDSQTLRIDLSKGNPEDNLDFIKQVDMDLSNESVEERRGNRRINLDCHCGSGWNSGFSP